MSDKHHGTLWHWADEGPAEEVAITDEQQAVEYLLACERKVLSHLGNDLVVDGCQTPVIYGKEVTDTGGVNLLFERETPGGVEPIGVEIKAEWRRVAEIACAILWTIQTAKLKGTPNTFAALFATGIRVGQLTAQFALELRDTERKVYKAEALTRPELDWDEILNQINFLRESEKCKSQSEAIKLYRQRNPDAPHPSTIRQKFADRKQ